MTGAAVNKSVSRHFDQADVFRTFVIKGKGFNVVTCEGTCSMNLVILSTTEISAKHVIFSRTD